MFVCSVVSRTKFTTSFKLFLRMFRSVSSVPRWTQKLSKSHGTTLNNTTISLLFFLVQISVWCWNIFSSFPQAVHERSGSYSCQTRRIDIGGYSSILHQRRKRRMETRYTHWSLRHTEHYSGSFHSHSQLFCFQEKCHVLTIWKSFNRILGCDFLQHAKESELVNWTTQSTKFHCLVHGTEVSFLFCVFTHFTSHWHFQNELLKFRSVNNPFIFYLSYSTARADGTKGTWYYSQRISYW